jgi:P22 coat protein - gene protein 5
MTYVTQGLTTDQITYEALVVLKNKLALGSRVLREFDSSFERPGAQIGDTVRVRVPPRFVTTTGMAPGSQTAVETFVPVPCQTQRNIELTFSDKDLTLSIDDFRRRFIEPQMAQLASDVDQDGVTAATVGYTITNSGYFTANYAGTYAGFQGLVTGQGYSANGIPTPWTGVDLGSTAGAANTATAPFFAAQARLTEQSAPMDERYCVICPAASACTQPNLLNQFNPQEEISEIFAEGYIGKLARASFVESPIVQAFQSGNWTNSGAATNVASAVANSNVIVVNGAGNNANIASGDQLAVAGVYAVNPLTRQQQSNKPQVFTVVGAATANATGVVSVTVFPSLNAASAGAQQTISALPSPGAQVTFLGTSNTTTAVNFMYQKNAIAMVVAPLVDDLAGAEVSTASDPDSDGLSVRYVRQYQALQGMEVRRIDILYGWGVVRPQLGIRIQA